MAVSGLPQAEACGIHQCGNHCMMGREKRPRQYAWEIYHMRKREDRLAALERVPEHLREWVQYQVIRWRERDQNCGRQDRKG